MAVIKFINGIEFQSQLIEKMAQAIQEAETDPRFYQRIFDTSDAYWHSRCYIALDAVWDDICDTLWDRWKDELEDKNKLLQKIAGGTTAEEIAACVFPDGEK